MEQEESALLYDLANSILEECKDAAMLSNLDTAIYLFREALNQRPAPHPLQSDSIKDLAAALVTRFSLTNQRHDLAQAISLLTEGMDGLYDGSAAHGEFRLDVSKYSSMAASDLSELAKTILAGFDQSAQLSSLDTAIMLHREALIRRPSPHPKQAVSLAGLCATLYVRFHYTGDRPNLDEVISLLREAIEACPETDISLSISLSHLSAALAIRFDRTGHSPDLDEAVTLHHDACQLPEEEASRLLRFASDLFKQFEQSAQLQSGRITQSAPITVLEKAISLYGDVRALLPVHHANWLIASINCTSMLCRRFEQLGRHEDLDECISLYRHALKQLPATHHDRCSVLNNLAAALDMKFRQSGRCEDRDEGILLQREILVLLPAHHPNQSGFLYNLANALYARFRHSGFGLPGLSDPYRSALFNNLAPALLTRFKQSSQCEDLDEAITSYRRVVEMLPAPHPYRSILDGLADALCKRFDQLGQSKDLGEAISFYQEVLELQPLPHPDRFNTLDKLAVTLLKLFQQSGHNDDLDKSISLLEEKLELRLAPDLDQSGS
ncbi:hypothetical protein PILCRDRAFT_78642, partial [Piloderma croceum F 1598]